MYCDSDISLPEWGILRSGEDILVVFWRVWA